MRVTGNAASVVADLMKRVTEKPDEVYDLTIHRQRRSLDSNAYFHVLCDKLRQKLGTSMARCKNHLIADYGQFVYLDDVPLIYKTNAPPDYVYEQEEPHMWLVKAGEENGKPVYFYRLYRGSHTYNSAEMARLIDGTVSECREQGIETMPPAELEKMMKDWERRYAKKHCDGI
jgi:hypothetical protein